jgi:hypothetical protein
MLLKKDEPLCCSNYSALYSNYGSNNCGYEPTLFFSGIIYHSDVSSGGGVSGKSG